MTTNVAQKKAFLLMEDAIAKGFKTSRENVKVSDLLPLLGTFEGPYKYHCRKLGKSIFMRAEIFEAENRYKEVFSRVRKLGKPKELIKRLNKAFQKGAPASPLFTELDIVISVNENGKNMVLCGEIEIVALSRLGFKRVPVTLIDEKYVHEVMPELLGPRPTEVEEVGVEQ